MNPFATYNALPGIDSDAVNKYINPAIEAELLSHHDETFLYKLPVDYKKDAAFKRISKKQTEVGNHSEAHMLLSFIAYKELSYLSGNRKYEYTDEEFGIRPDLLIGANYGDHIPVLIGKFNEKSAVENFLKYFNLTTECTQFSRDGQSRTTYKLEDEKQLPYPTVITVPYSMEGVPTNKEIEQLDAGVDGLTNRILRIRMDFWRVSENHPQYEPQFVGTLEDA